MEGLAADVTRVRLARAGDDAPVTMGETPRPVAQPAAKRETRVKPNGKRSAPDPSGGMTPKAIDLLYFVDGAGLFAAAGSDPRDSLRALVKASHDGAALDVPRPKPRPAMASALAAVGSEATFVLIADALRISAMTGGSAPPAPPAPLVIAAGRSRAPAELWARVDLPNVVAQQLVEEYARRRAALPAAPP
jgi:hypothetical protein